jgi:HTH-type transcriptional repressor of NAD biosynthesis genes
LEQKKRYKKGFVLGKFLPPHTGHLHLVRSAMAETEELTVLVCTIQKEPIPGRLRYQWMCALFPDARVIHVTDEVPSYPHEHPDFESIWTNLLKREIDPDTEIFFSSEDYGDDVARWLNIEHVLIDKERIAFPVSGTNIRNEALKHWEFIPEIVRPYFVKRIVLTGPESTGKTTMAQKLAEHFRTVWVEEYGRDYFVQKNGNLVLEDLTAIAEGQVLLEDQALLQANKLLFCDTDLVVTQVWSEIYFKQCPQAVIDLSHERHYDLHLLMDIDIPWEDDGTREFPHLREWHFKRLKEELDNRNYSYEIISGNFEERLEACIRAIHERFS